MSRDHLDFYHGLLGLIHLVVAWAPEAEPLIERFDLRIDPAAGAERVYVADGIRLIICGMGRKAAEAAVASIAGSLLEEPPGIWMNIGIGGHRSLPHGEARLADRVARADSQEIWRLEPPVESPFETAQICSVDRVETEYRGDCIYEMEAAGFCRAATALGRADSIQVLKVISDNRQRGVETVTRQLARELIAAHLGKIEALIDLLVHRAKEPTP